MKDQTDLKQNAAPETTEQLSLNDDRRVKVLSPTALVFKRFFRNSLSVAGLIMILAMFLFSFLGGFLSPYEEDEIFYTYTDMKKSYVSAKENNSFRYLRNGDVKFRESAFQNAYNKGLEQYEDRDLSLEIEELGTDLYRIYSAEGDVALAFKDILTPLDETEKLTFDETKAALTAYTNGDTAFTAGERSFTIDEDGNVLENGAGVAFISRFIVKSAEQGLNISPAFRSELEDAIDNGDTEFRFIDEDGTESVFLLDKNRTTQEYSVLQDKSTYVKDTYSRPSKAHLLGTDSNGMDMLTRLMYGGRVSLVIGFIVVFIAAFLGVLFGGISGYFGGWVDNLIMRIVDIFYCIPSMPLIIILGAAMDAMQIDPKIRMLYLMLILGFLSWPSIARLIRGQILSLREQEFMTATEACGISIHRRIFQHLIPNVIPQLIVICTMDLGSTILTEATLSFLGLGVKFPFASWGNIINDVNNSFVMTNYWFIWIPAGICLLISVLAFNFIGDGLRDAFDPKMKR